MKSETLDSSNPNNPPETNPWESVSDVSFSGERREEETPETRFNVDPKEFSILSQQAGRRDRYGDGHYAIETLSINETLGLMVGRTAETIAVLCGDNEHIPAADHVIYLDKSARPVSWMVNQFWKDFTNKEKPERSYLAIDRRQWLKRSGVELLSNEYIADPDGSTRPARASDFDINKIPRETLARIRALYIEGGIEDEDVDKIMQTPTVLDGKNVTIIDEVSRSGSTLGIAQCLIRAAIPEVQSVNGHVFWSDLSMQTASGETQMGSTPAWYPHDKSDWRGRGVKNINPEYFDRVYEENPTPKNRANKFGSIVLGEPLEDPKDEPGQLSWKLQEDIAKMHEEYRKGHILPSFPGPETMGGEVDDRMCDYLEGLGVELCQPGDAKNPKRAYPTLLKKRNALPPLR